jgi:hypothetical protein
VRGAEVGDEHDARGLVERQRRRRPPAGRDRAARLVHELVGEQRLDALGDRRAGEPGLADEVGARLRAAVADQPEHQPRTRR